MLKNEHEFVLNLIKQEFNNEYLLNTDIDWSYIIELCNTHRLLPILYNRVKNSSVTPKHIKQLLLNNYKANECKSLDSKKEYLNVLENLAANGVDVILLKGVYLSNKCYSDFAERLYGDMDILIKSSDKQQTFDILAKLGYTQGSFDYHQKKVKLYDPGRLLDYEQELQHYGEFVKASDSIFTSCFSIDVHHRLNTSFDNFSYDIEELFDRAIRDNIDGIGFLKLSNEDFLLHLISHLYVHTLTIQDIISDNDIRLSRYYDIALFVYQHPINWDKLFKFAESYNLTNALYCVLYHCQLIFGNIVPNNYYAQLDPNKLIELSNTIHDKWFTRNTLTPVGRWSEGFMERLFDENRKYKALFSFYNDYVMSEVLFKGNYFEVVDISSK